MIPEIKSKGFIINDIIHLSGKECIELCEQGAVLIDLREEYEIAGRQFAVENRVHLPYSIFKDNYLQLPKDELLIFADGVGLRSKEAIIFLKENGFTNIANLAGGIVDWEREGCKVLTNKNEMLNGQCACMLRSKTGQKFNFKF